MATNVEGSWVVPDSLKDTSKVSTGKDSSLVRQNCRNQKRLAQASLKKMRNKEEFLAAPMPWTCYDDRGIWFA